MTTKNQEVEDFGVLQGAFPIKSIPDTEIDEDHLGQASIAARKTFSRQDPIRLRAALKLGLKTSGKFLLDGVDIRIELQPAQGKYVINAANANLNAFDYEVQKIQLEILKVKPTNVGLLSASKYVLSKDIEYIIRRNPCKSYIMQTGLTEFSVNRPWNNTVPNQLYIWMVRLEGDTGDVRYSPFNLRPYQIQKYSAKINGLEQAGHGRP